VALSGDQELVEAFPAERADEAFRDRVREHMLEALAGAFTQPVAIGWGCSRTGCGTTG
jgi:hypothetical protein